MHKIRLLQSFKYMSTEGFECINDKYRQAINISVNQSRLQILHLKGCKGSTPVVYFN